MTSTIAILFAQQRPDWNEVAKSFENRPTGVVPFVMTVFLLVLVASLVATMIWYRRREQEEHLRDPRRMFQELSAAHELDRAQRGLLKDLAKLADSTPEVLFVRRDLFALGAERWRMQNARRDVAPIERLERILFQKSEGASPSA